MTADTEIRIALVMNGGVSLAVWMGGVAHEIDLLRRASSGTLPPPPGSADEPVYDAWRALCSQYRVRVVVDVIAGTSAGGLNGSLLATSIARGAPLPPDLQDVWCQTAQLGVGALVPPDGTTALSSVLDGKFFQDRVEQVFGSIEGMDEAARQPVALFVTATALGEQCSTVVDTFGSDFPVPDHRRLYRFSYDPSSRTFAHVVPGSPVPQDPARAFPERPEDGFTRGETPRLARAARASAGFPLAFAPVEEVGEDVDLRPVRVRGSGEAWLVDGGILDNAPFDPVLDEIAGRPVDQPWRRVLAYVVPSGAEPPAMSSNDRPGWLPVLGAAVRLPAEADLRSDVDRLTRLSRDAEHWAQQPQELFRTLRGGTSSADFSAAAAALFGQYRQSRVNSGVTDAMWLWAEASQQRPVTLRSPQDADPDIAEGWSPPAQALVAPSREQWTWGTAVADRSLRLMLRDAGARASAGTLPGAAGAGLRRLSTLISCVTALRDELESRIRSKSIANAEAVDALHVINEATRDTRTPELLMALLRAAATDYLRLVEEQFLHAEPPAEAVEAVLRDCLLVEVLTRAFAGRARFQRTAAFDFVHMGPDIDSPVVRSVKGPGDAAPRRFGSWKLWGTQLNHFGAFGDPDWRRQDWLWGRLDGAAHLIRIIISAGTQDPEERRQATAMATAELHTRILTAAGTDADQVTEQLRTLAGLDTRSVLTALRSTPEGRDTAESAVAAVLRTLRSREAGIPAPVTAVGDWLSIVLARSVGGELGNQFLEDAVRFAATAKRERFWQIVRDDPAQPDLFGGGP